MDNMRIIHTHLYSKIALEVLQSVEGNLSDGMWENSPAMEKYWRFSNVETASDGEVLIKVDTKEDEYVGTYHSNKWLHNGFYGWSDDQVLEWFAAKVKHIMVTELKDETYKNGWKRDNDKFETQYLSYKETITVSDVYFIYDFLMGRDTARKYSISQHQKIEGEPKTEEETKKEQAKRDAYDRAENAYQKERAEIEAWKKAEIEKIERTAEERRLKAFQTLSVFKPL